MKAIIIFNFIITLQIATSSADENKVRRLRGQRTTEHTKRSLNDHKFDVVKSLAANDACMEMSLETGNNVEMHPCNEEQKQTQAWYFDTNTNQIINKYDLKCLDVKTSNNNILAWKCHGRENQKWELDSGMIKSSWNGKCLTITSSNNFILSDCKYDDNQKFYFTQGDGPNPTPPIEWTSMRSFTYDMVRCVESFEVGDDVSVTPCDFEEEMQNWRYDPTSNKILNKGNGLCLDINTSNGNILVWSCHGRINQQWYWDSNNKLRSHWNNKCVDIKEETNGLHLSSCNDVQNQYFYV